MQTTGLNGAYTPKYYTVNFLKQNSSIGSNPWLAQRGIRYKGYPIALRKRVLRVEERYRKMKIAQTSKDIADQAKRKEFTPGGSKFDSKAETKTVHLKAKEGERVFHQTLYVVNGAQTAEQFCIWWKEIDETFIAGQQDPAYDKMKTVLQSLTKGEAYQVVTDCYKEMLHLCNNPRWSSENYKVVCNHLVRQKMTEMYDDFQKLANAIDTDDFQMFCYKECMWRLQVLFFGNDCYGKNSSKHLKRLMGRIKSEPKYGAKAYRKRMTELQSYIPYTTWEVGLKQGEWEPKPLTED